MAKGFVAHALSNDLPSISPIIEWVYVKPGGPRFLSLVIEESRSLISRAASIGRRTKVLERLSAGAEILLQPHLRALEAKAAELDVT